MIPIFIGVRHACPGAAASVCFHPHGSCRFLDRGKFALPLDGATQPFFQPDLGLDAENFLAVGHVGNATANRFCEPMYPDEALPQWLGGGDYGVWFDSYFGLIMIHIAFQTGFCTFVLSNYMKTLPKELDEAARVDGAGVIRHFFTIILPLCRPALAALATLEFTWIYNDFFWAATLMTTGDKLPITSAINNFKGEFFTDTNLIAAGSLLIAIPTMVIYFALQRHFIGGLTLGASKG